MKLISAVIGAIILNFSLGNVWADTSYQWKFTVPVKAHNLDPYVKAVWVNVRVLDSKGKIVGGASAWGSTAAPVSATGDVNQTIEVKVKPDPGSDIADAVKYRVELQLESKFPQVVPVNHPSYAWTQSKPGTTVVAVIEEELPKSESQAQMMAVAVKIKGL